MKNGLEGYDSEHKSYLGHFNKPSILRDGHNTVEDKSKKGESWGEWLARKLTPAPIQKLEDTLNQKDKQAPKKASGK